MAIAIFGQLVERARKIASGEIVDPRQARHISIFEMRIGDRRALCVHRLEQAANIIGDNIGLQCPAGIHITKDTRHIGDVVEHHALIADMLARLGRATVDAEFGLAHHHKVEAGCGNDNIRLELASRLQLDTGRCEPLDMIRHDFGFAS